MTGRVRLARKFVDMQSRFSWTVSSAPPPHRSNGALLLPLPSTSPLVSSFILFRLPTGPRINSRDSSTMPPTTPIANPNFTAVVVTRRQDNSFPRLKGHAIAVVISRLQVDPQRAVFADAGRNTASRYLVARRARSFAWEW